MIRCHAGRVLAALTLAAIPGGLPAQTARAMLDVGTARMTYADSIVATAVTISPAFRAASPRAAVAAFGTFSQLRGSYTNSGRIDASVTPLTHELLSAELSGAAGGSSHGNGTRTGQMMGFGRLHVATTSRGVYGGAGAGRTWDGTWRHVLQGDVGGWVASEMTSLVASVAPTAVDDTIRYLDGHLMLRHSLPAVDLDAMLGMRAGQQLPSLPANHSAWGSLSATWWATPRFGIVATGGTYPVDFTQGFPGGRYAALSARIRSAPPARAAVAPRAAAGISAFSLQRTSGTTHAIRVQASAARSVEVSGDFTLWSPLALRPEGNGWWSVTVPLAAGTHEITVRLNDGAWVVPPGVTSRVDEFGGSVGVVHVR